MVIAYLRVITGKQHLESQKDEIERYVSERSFKVDKWLIDIVDEKRKDKEPSLKRVLERMKEGDKVIITDIARFGRRLSEVMELLGGCMAKGVHVYSINDRYLLDGQMNCKAIAKVCGLVSEIEHHLMSERTKEALNHKKDKGLKLGRPKGTDAKQSMLDANKEEVMDMIERGDTVITICKHFNVSRNTFYQFKKNYGF